MTALGKAIVSVVMIGTCAGLPALAQATSAGRVQLNVSADDINAVVIGEGSSSTVSIGAIEKGAKIRSTANLAVRTDDTYSVAIGRDANASAYIGVIDDGARLNSASINVSTDDSAVLALGNGSDACLSIGSIGGIRAGNVGTAASVGDTIAVDIGRLWSPIDNLNIATVGKKC